MSAKLSVIFYIILCFEIGLFLTVLPWWPHGMWGISDWGNNYFLLYAARKTGIQGLQAVVSSGGGRGGMRGRGWGGRRWEWRRSFEPWYRVLGDFQLQTHRRCFANPDEPCEAIRCR